MKRNLFTIIILLFASCCLFALTVTASDESSAKLDLTFTINPWDVNPSSPPEEPDEQEPGNTPTYEINIPTAMNLNIYNEAKITANYVTIGEGNTLVVAIDGSKTFSDENFYLRLGAGDDATKLAPCTILRSSVSNALPEYKEIISGPEDAIVATFKDGTTEADTYGYVRVEPGYGSKNLAGMYTGTVYFKAYVVES